MARPDGQGASRSFLTKHSEPAPPAAWAVALGVIVALTVAGIAYSFLAQ